MLNNVFLFINVSGFLFIMHFMMVTRQRSLFAPGVVFNIGFFYSYFIAGFLFINNPQQFTVYPEIKKNLEFAELYFLVAWMGLIPFNLAYAGRPFPVASVDKRVKDSASCYLPCAVYVLSVASVAAIAVVIDLDPIALITNVEEWEFLRNRAMTSWADNGVLFVLPIYMAFFHIWLMVAMSPGRLLSVLLFVVTLSCMLVIGSRAMILSWVISLLALKYAFSGQKFKFTQVFMIVLIASGGAILGQFQNQNVLAQSLVELDFPFNHLKRLQVSYEQFENLVALVDADFSFDWGRSIFEDVFLTYIPRTLFPWKPDDIGFIRAQNVLFYKDFWSVSRATTYPVGIIGELYFNFWYIGVPLGMYVLGRVVRFFEVSAASRPLYLPLACTLSGVFLAPHRTYGLIFLMIFIYIILLNVGRISFTRTR